jgi:hypothetical protein
MCKGDWPSLLDPKVELISTQDYKQYIFEKPKSCWPQGMHWYVSTLLDHLDKKE